MVFEGKSLSVEGEEDGGKGAAAFFFLVFSLEGGGCRMGLGFLGFCFFFSPV